MVILVQEMSQGGGHRGHLVNIIINRKSDDAPFPGHLAQGAQAPKIHQNQKTGLVAPEYFRFIIPEFDIAHGHGLP